MKDILEQYKKSKISHKIRDWSFLDNYSKDVVSLYEEGYGVITIGRKIFGYELSSSIVRSFVYRILKSNNIRLRTESEQRILDYKIKYRDKFKQTHKANAMRKGTHDKLETRIRRAKFNEKNYSISLKKSKYEKLLFDYLVENRIEFEYQKRFFQFNVDFLINNVAVELTGGHFRNYSDNDFKTKKDVLFDNNINAILIFRCDKNFNPENVFKIVKDFDLNKTSKCCVEYSSKLTKKFLFDD